MWHFPGSIFPVQRTARVASLNINDYNVYPSQVGMRWGGEYGAEDQKNGDGSTVIELLVIHYYYFKFILTKILFEA